MKEWLHLLRKLDIFGGLTDEELSPLIVSSQVKIFESKQIIFSEGHDRHYLCVLKTGVVLVTKLSEDGEERVINVLTDGEIFPHTGFFDNRPYPGTAQVKKRAEILLIPIKAFESFIKANPQIAFPIIQMMSKKINELQNKLNDLLSLNVEDRILAALQQLNGLTNNELQLTHQELANIVGATRETVTRQLKKLEKERKIKIHKENIELFL